MDVKKVEAGCGMRSGKGFTLIEVLLSLGIFAVVVVGLMGFCVSLAALRESSRNLSQASSDARAVLEQMRETSAGGLAAITAMNWTNWAANNSLTVLENEAIAVNYANPNVDPLDITVQVSWTERGRARAASFESLVTRR